MLLVTCDEVIGPGSISAFEYDVVFWISADLEHPRGRYLVGAIADELQHLQSKAFTDGQLGSL
jgi:hypothetical protein